MWRSYEKPKYSADLQRKNLAPYRNIEFIVNSVSIVNIPYRQPLYGPTPINACFLLPSQ